MHNMQAFSYKRYGDIENTIFNSICPYLLSRSTIINQIFLRSEADFATLVCSLNSDRFAKRAFWILIVE